MRREHEVLLRPVPRDDDAGGSTGGDRARVRGLVREVVEEYRQRMLGDGRVLCGGRWRTREEIRWLRWQTRLAALARWRDIALVLCGLAAVVAVAYLFRLFLLP
jgi:hypothetical protein